LNGWYLVVPCFKKKVLFLIGFILAITIISTLNTTSAVNNAISEPSILFITENSADYELAYSISQNIEISANISDIKTSTNLNQLFLEGHILNDYSGVVLIMNQVTNPLNSTVISNLQNYIKEGNLFSIISAQIWRFPDSFHSLLGLEISAMGQKEWPQGNVTGNIQLSITNNTFLQSPFEFANNSILDIQGEVGIAQTVDIAHRVAISQNTPNGNMSVTAFPQENGFIIAAPLSPNEISPSLTNISILVSSLMNSAVNHIQESIQSNQEFNVSPPFMPFLSISDEVIETGIVLGNILTLLLGFAYTLPKLLTKTKVELDLPKDNSLFISLIISPFLFIAQIIYPPIIRRIDEYDVLENEYRNQIIDILNEKDFLHFRELRRELNIGISSLKWHLQVLEDFRIIRRQVFGQYEILYLSRKKPDHGFLELYFSIVSGGGYRIAQAFSKVNSWDLNSLTQYLGQSKEAIRYHVKKMQDIQLLHLKKDQYILNPHKRDTLLKALNRRKKTN